MPREAKAEQLKEFEHKDGQETDDALFFEQFKFYQDIRNDPKQSAESRLRADRMLLQLLKDRLDYVPFPPPPHVNLHPSANGANLGLRPKEEPMPRSLNSLGEREIESLPLKAFKSAARRTRDPRKIVMGFNANSKAEDALQQALRQYLKDEHGVEPKGKITLSATIINYKSAKNGVTYKGYMQAFYDGRGGKTLYTLTEEEIAEELKRRAASKSSSSSLTLTK